MNAKEIATDIERLNNPHFRQNSVSSKAVLQNEENIFICEGAQIQAGTVLIADDGPIYVGKNAKISAGAIIEGPAAICKESVIKLGAKIRSNTTVGPICKVGGEVSKSIFTLILIKATTDMPAVLLSVNGVIWVPERTYPT